MHTVARAVAAWQRGSGGIHTPSHQVPCPHLTHLTHTHPLSLSPCCLPRYHSKGSLPYFRPSPARLQYVGPGSGSRPVPVTLLITTLFTCSSRRLQRPAAHSRQPCQDPPKPGGDITSSLKPRHRGVCAGWQTNIWTQKSDVYSLTKEGFWKSQRLERLASTTYCKCSTLSCPSSAAAEPLGLTFTCIPLLRVLLT